MKTNWLWVLVCAMSFLQACVKDSDVFLSEYDNNKLGLVVADNFNLSVFNATLIRSGMSKVLNHETGPFTLLAPSDAAFKLAGYNDQTAILTASATTISRIALYHTLDGQYELNKLPFLFNQELNSKGGKLFATHWIKGADTVLTINGSRIVAQNVQASNGLIQVIDRVLSPYVHDQITDAISGRSDLTLFYEAIRTSGLLPMLREKGPYTIFAPNNQAMMAMGYSTIQQIHDTKPAELAAFVKYHVVKDRRFIYDYILSTGPSNVTKQAMLDGNLINISLVPNVNAPGTFDAITLKGNGNTTQVKLLTRDELCGNGVLHSIDATLKLYQ